MMCVVCCVLTAVRPRNRNMERKASAKNTRVNVSERRGEKREAAEVSALFKYENRICIFFISVFSLLERLGLKFTAISTTHVSVPLVCYI